MVRKPVAPDENIDEIPVVLHIFNFCSEWQQDQITNHVDVVGTLWQTWPKSHIPVLILPSPNIFPARVVMIIVNELVIGTAMDKSTDININNYQSVLL